MNTQLFRKMGALVAVSGLLILATACGEVSGVDDGMGEVKVTLQEAAAEALFQVSVADLDAAPAAMAARVSRDLVRTLDVVVNGIQILPYCEEPGEQDGDAQCEDLWEELDLGGTTYDLDLLALPSEEEDAITLAEDIVPVGEYHKIRLFVSEANVTFLEDVRVGQSTFLAFDANEDYDPDDSSTEVVYPVEIPSAENTGLKADISLEVTEETTGEVGLLFDADATFRNVIATGSGRVKIPPVLKARPMHQEQNQEQIQNQNGG